MTILFLLAQKDFQDYEYSATKKVLEEGGKTVCVASETTEIAYGKFMRVKPKLNFSEAFRRIDEFEAVVVIGGPGCVNIMNNTYAIKLVQQARKDGKITAAICWGPRILAKAGVLKDHKATVNCSGPDSEVGRELIESGAKWSNEKVVADGKVITAFGPPFATEFGKAILKKLNE